MWLVAGIAWIVIALLVLQFDTTSATTIGIVAGVLFVVAGLQYFAIGAVVDGWKWVWILLGAILVVGGIVSLVYPERTFIIVANILGFMFALTGIFWMIQSFVVRDVDELWWMTLIAGILMITVGFWLTGQLIGVQAATLVVFVGLWSMFRGILDIVAAFQLRRANEEFGQIADTVRGIEGTP